MSSGGSRALKEDEALTHLKVKLSVPSGSLNAAERDAYLLRFLRSKNLAVEEAAGKLARRKQFERTLPAMTVTPSMLSALQSHHVVVVGVDVLSRPVVYVNSALFRHIGESSNTEKLAIMILEYITSSTAYHKHECVVLVNQEGAAWWSDANLHQRLATLVDKYYPEVVGQILVVNASWGNARIMRSTISQTSTRVKNRIQIVSRADLQRYIDVSVVPVGLGGQNNINVTYPAHEFADKILRHWFLLTTKLANEVTAANSSAVYEPTFIQTSGARGLEQALVHVARRTSTAGSSTVRTRRAVSLPPLDGDDMCSVLSDDDTMVDADDGETPTQQRAAPPAIPQTMLSTNTTRVSEALMGQLETTLRLMHEEVNVLIGNIIVDVKQAGDNPSVAQLLDVTDQALQRVIQERTQVPAFRGAPPVGPRGKKNSHCVVA